MGILFVYFVKLLIIGCYFFKGFGGVNVIVE